MRKLIEAGLSNSIIELEPLDLGKVLEPILLDDDLLEEMTKE